MFSRTNIPFLTAGAIASLALLTSGVFAVAPYVTFLSSVAALNIAPPFIFILFALSAVVIVFLYKMIKQNKKSQENSKAEVNEPNKGLRKEENTRAPIIEVSEDKGAKENKEKFSGLEKKVDRISENFATKDEVDGLKKEVIDLSAKLINSPATKDEVEVKLNMKFYAKGEERGWNTAFDDIILPSSIKEDLREICKSKGGGYLLNGKGGTGKTSICEAIANEIKSQFAVIRISASSLCNVANIDQVFERARESTPCIIIMEEIDGIGLDRESGKNRNVESLTHLLDKLNKTFLEENIVIATTNRANDLDGALVRHERLRKIEIPVLEKESTRRGILKEHLKELSYRDVETIVNSTNDFSVANLIGLAKYIQEEREKMKSKGKSIPIFTLCERFKKEHNIEDKKNEKHSNGKIKNEGTRMSSGSSRSSSASSSLSDVFSQVSAQQIQQ
ncbi:AAA family ATPase [Wolbachia endosymbiont (group B) of Gerris lacustris]|uniref:AAA family ATPase n=1 Tax=Wolbachia endosymbiont (group B) of Gerris lacustris TaxID=3066159 RepID=UPI003342C2E2